MKDMTSISNISDSDEDKLHKATYPSIRLFKNPVLEWCTHVHPIVPLLLWGPIIFFLLSLGLVNGELSVWGKLSLVFLGLFTWTFIEYSLHRFLFHFPAKSKAGKYFVFLFHGLHHDDPNDPTRLVFPPVPALLIFSLIFLFFSLFFQGAALYLFTSGFLIGYLCYDYIHFATHHFKMTSRVGKFLKKYHLQHHHLQAPVKYGVSSPLWDFVFGTYYSEKEKNRKEKLSGS